MSASNLVRVFLVSLLISGWGTSLQAGTITVGLGLDNDFDNLEDAIDFAEDDNAPAMVGPVIISEIMYHPDSQDQSGEYVELWNISDSAVTLYQPDMDLSCRIMMNGLFEFPKDLPVTLPAGGRLLVAHDPDAMVAMYGDMLADVSVFGPYDFSLPDYNGVVELHMPEITSFGYFVLDRLEYNRDALLNTNCSSWQSYWPLEANGQGASLTRLHHDRPGNEPLNWEAALPTPGF